MTTLNAMIDGLRAVREASLEYDERRRAQGDVAEGRIAYELDGASLDNLIELLEETRGELATCHGAVRRMRTLAIQSMVISGLSLVLALVRLWR